MLSYAQTRRELPAAVSQERPSEQEQVRNFVTALQVFVCHAKVKVNNFLLWTNQRKYSQQKSKCCSR